MDRIAYFDSTWEMILLGWTSHPMATVTSSLPADARISYLVLNHERRSVRVFVTSDTFAPVPEGGVIPEIEVRMSMAYG